MPSKNNQRGWIYLPLVLLATMACGRDFALPELTFALESVEMSPGIVRKDVELELLVRSSGAQPDAVSAHLLGQSFVDAGLQADGTWRLTHVAGGSEPEGAEVRVDVEATLGPRKVTAITWARFDFTPPILLATAAERSLLESDGESVAIDFTFDEALREDLEVSVAGKVLPCVPITRVGWRCTVTAEPAISAGWLEAFVSASDLAGNRLTTPTELGLAIDRAAAPSPLAITLLSQDPSPATVGQAVALRLGVSTAVKATPVVTVAGRAVSCEPLGFAQREFGCLYHPRQGDPAPPDPLEPLQMADLVADAESLQGVLGHLEADVALDLWGPRVLEIVPTRTHLVADQALTLFIRFDEAIASAQASIQGRDLLCGISGTTSVSCRYQTSGNELGGPQQVLVTAIDLVGNTSIEQVDAGLEFDFACEQIASRAFVVNSTVRPTVFMAEARAFESGASVALSLFEGAPSFATLMASPDGGIPATALPPSIDRFVWFQATDPDGHPCAWARSAQRFMSVFSDDPTQSSINQATALRPGIRAMNLSAYTVDRGASTRPPPLASTERVKLAGEDARSVVIQELTLSPVSWSKLGRRIFAPSTIFPGPLTWDPTSRSIVRYWATTSYSQISRWDGTRWSVPDIFPRPVPHTWGWATAFSQAETTFFVYGGVGSGSPLSSMLRYDGYSLERLFPSTLPTGRIYPGLTYHEQIRQLVLFGGAEEDASGNIRPNGETWAWDGSFWRPVDPPLEPPARYSPVFVTDEVRGDAYLFGGSNQAGPFDDTWIFDGLSWEEASPPLRPPARSLAGATYHGGFEEMLVFGGRDQNNLKLQDLWGFDGSTWTEHVIAGGPPALTDGGVAYDPLRGVLVVYGGYDVGNNPMKDLYELSAVARFPQLLVQFRLPPFVESSSVATVALVAKGSVVRTGFLEEGIEADLWDDVTNRWWPLSLPSSGITPSGLRSYAIALNEGILSRQQVPWAFVLIRTRAPATEQGGATLEVDSVSLQIDTF